MEQSEDTVQGWDAFCYCKDVKVWDFGLYPRRFNLRAQEGMFKIQRPEPSSFYYRSLSSCAGSQKCPMCVLESKLGKKLCVRFVCNFSPF